MLLSPIDVSEDVVDAMVNISSADAFSEDLSCEEDDPVPEETGDLELPSDDTAV